MSMMVSLLLLIAPQTAPAAEAQSVPAPAQDPIFKQGMWTGECWAHDPKGRDAAAPGFCRVTGGKAGKMWIMVERSPAQMLIYASGSCPDETPPVAVPQDKLTGADRLQRVGAAIDIAVAKASEVCKAPVQERFPGTPGDIATLLTVTDGVLGAK